MENKVYGYARVSTREQNEDRQMIALENYPMSRKQIYLDKLSGKDFNRPQYQKLLAIQNRWRKITKEKNVNIVVLDMPLLDTRSTGNNLTGTFVADLVLQILSYVAQTERENIRQRQREGIEAARMRGVRFGRPRKEIPENFEILKHQWQQNLIASRQAAKELGVSQDTFLRWAHGK